MLAKNQNNETYNKQLNIHLNNKNCQFQTEKIEAAISARKPDSSHNNPKARKKSLDSLIIDFRMIKPLKFPIMTPIQWRRIALQDQHHTCGKSSPAKLHCSDAAVTTAFGIRRAISVDCKFNARIRRRAGASIPAEGAKLTRKIYARGAGVEEEEVIMIIESLLSVRRRHGDCF